MNEESGLIGACLFSLLMLTGTASCVSQPVRRDIALEMATPIGPRHVAQSMESEGRNPLFVDAVSSLMPGNVPRVTGVKGGADRAVTMQSQPVKLENIRQETEVKPSHLSEDDTAFRDLPTVELDAETLKESQGVGNDEVIKMELKRLLKEFGEEVDEAPPIFVQEVKAYIRIFQTNPQYRKFIASSLRRSSAYLPFVKGVLNERNIPEDMAYIAFIESGFNKKARSRAGALGLWQFMPGTARAYSLKVGKDMDERLDPSKSTYAAVDYFHDLVAIFGSRSFMLALAAYNCGEYRIISCLKKIDNPLEERHFWHIRACLPRETREYPPRIIAAAIIGNNPEMFGFPEPKEGDDVIEDLPPRRPEFAKTTATMLPSDKTGPNGNRVDNKLGRNPIPKNERYDAKQNLTIYTAKKGNTVPMLAEALSIKQEDLRHWNGIKGDVLKPGVRLKVYTTTELSIIHYRVKRGDSITEIGQAFGVRPGNIVAFSGLRNGLDLKAGQTLVLYKRMNSRPLVHRVTPGSNLMQIAGRYSVKTRDVMMWNNLGSSVIRPQQKLKIYMDMARET